MSHKRIAICLAALLLSASALTAPAQAGWFDFGSDSADKAPVKADKQPPAAKAQAPAQDLDGAIRQAVMMRNEARYDDAIKSLSQIMLVAADDPRVVTEYGKTLAAMGRASDAVNFLTRAQQLAPNDWSVYSAMGVAYDQTGDHVKAQAAYEHALALRPNESSALNNYALSRMMTGDAQGAHALIARAQAAGGGADPKIARNIAMMLQLSPEGQPAPALAEAAPVPAPHMEAQAHPLPPVGNSRPPVTDAPRPLVANNDPIQPKTQVMQQQPGVVMQRVPEDPLAGPVHHVDAAKTNPSKISASRHQTKAVMKTANSPASNAKAFEARAATIAKQLASKPQAETVAAAGKPDAFKAAAKPEIKPVVKAAEGKPSPVKLADAKAPAKTDAQPIPAKKETVPALRVSASAY